MAGAAGDIVEWAVGAGLNELSQSDLIAGYCERLVEAGVPLWRASIGADTLHPLIDAQGHRWLQGEGIREEFIFRASAPAREDEWRRSPWYRMVETNEGVMRRRLAAGEGTNEFPLLANLATQGATDEATIPGQTVHPSHAFQQIRALTGAGRGATMPRISLDEGVTRIGKR